MEPDANTRGYSLKKILVRVNGKFQFIDIPGRELTKTVASAILMRHLNAPS